MTALRALDVVEPVKQNTPEWERLRKRGIGGSDVPALLGVSPWTTAAELYDYKVGALARLPMNDAMEWGHDLEEPILRRYARRTGFELRKQDGILRHPDFSWALASLDAEAYDPDVDAWIPVDAKSSLFGFGVGYGEEGSGDVPLYIAAQMQWYCFVTGAPRAEIAALIGRPPIRLFVIERDDALIERIVAIAEDFWLNNVRAGVRPEADYQHRSTKDYLSRVHRDEGDEIEASDEIAQLVAELKELREARTAAETAVDAAENAIRDFMGSHSKLVGDGFSVSWKSQKGRTKVDWSAIAHELGEPSPELIEKHTSTGAPFRVFRPTFR